MTTARPALVDVMQPQTATVEVPPGMFREEVIQGCEFTGVSMPVCGNFYPWPLPEGDGEGLREDPGGGVSISATRSISNWWIPWSSATNNSSRPSGETATNSGCGTSNCDHQRGESRTGRGLGPNHFTDLIGCSHEFARLDLIPWRVSCSGRRCASLSPDVTKPRRCDQGLKPMAIDQCIPKSLLIGPD